MKYCKKCGNSLFSSAQICPYCGTKVGTSVHGYNYLNSNENKDNNKVANSNRTNNDLRAGIKFFLVLSCIARVCLIIPIIWVIPMTSYYFRKTRCNERVSFGYKICCILFVSVIAGCLMLCETND